MGKMKDLHIDQINQDRNGPDDTDWNSSTTDGEPSHIAVSSDGKRCWEIKSLFIDDVKYKIWASSYKEALELLPMIEDL